MVTAAGMRYVNIPLSGLMPPSAADTTLILGLLKDPATGPVFVHCKRGADRTGGVIAAYRIDHDKWGNRRALKEAKANGMSRLQIPRQNYIRSFRRGSAREASGAASSSGAPADKETGSDASK